MSSYYSRGKESGNASFDSTNEDGKVHKDVTYEGDTTRDRYPLKDVTRRADTSQHTVSSSSRHEVDYPDKVEYSCDEARGCQKLSFALLVLAFMGHAIAVCTPYWAVAYDGDQMSLYEGVWLSCVKQNREMGSWFCSNYGTARQHLLQPAWYQAAQVCAFLSLLLLIPAVVAATLYSFVVALPGRSRASWVTLAFLVASCVLSFLSFVIYGAGYDMDQRFPTETGRPRFHVSFALQIISCCILVLCIGTHIRDAKGYLKVWDNNKDVESLPSRVPSWPAGEAAHKTTALPAKSKAGFRIPSFNLQHFPEVALKLFRGSKKDNSSPPSQQGPAGAAPATTSSAMAREEVADNPRGATGGRQQKSFSEPVAKSGVPSIGVSRSDRVASYEAYDPPVNESFRSRDSQV